MQPPAGSLYPYLTTQALIHLAFMPQTSILAFKSLEFFGKKAWKCGFIGNKKMLNWTVHDIVVGNVLSTYCQYCSLTPSGLTPGPSRDWLFLLVEIICATSSSTLVFKSVVGMGLNETIMRGLIDDLACLHNVAVHICRRFLLGTD